MFPGQSGNRKNMQCLKIIQHQAISIDKFFNEIYE